MLTFLLKDDISQSAKDSLHHKKDNSFENHVKSYTIMMF